MAASDPAIPSGPPAAIPGRRRSWLAGLARSNVLGLTVAILALATALGLATPGFAGKFNVYALSRTVAVDIVLGFSMMVVLVTGGLNLAVGAIGVASAMAGGWLMQTLGLPIAVALPLALALGAAMGAVNGLIVVLTRLHSFVVTLATMSIFFGLMVLLTKAQAFNGLPPALVGFGRLRPWGGWVSPLLFVSAGLGLLLLYLYRLTATGRSMLAAGANPRAAQLSGLPVGRLFVLCHAMSGALAAVVGVMLTIRNGAALPSMAGQLGADWLLPAFLAPVLGGTLLTGGAVSVVGTALGAVFVDVLTNGLYMLRVGEFWIQSFLGLVLLGAVLLDRLRARLQFGRGGGVA
jgi:ribose transport system permease protein